MQFMRAIGQAPIEVRAEVEGFVLNRLQWALLGEALHLVERGYCSAEDIDLVLTHGLARRWVFYGPFATGHLNADAGLAGYFSGLREAMDRVRNSLHADFEPSADTIARIHASMVAKMPLEGLSDRKLSRDDKLLQLNAFLEGSEKA
jgi:3-hydroxyacyl-CoA dehydrogenase